MDFLTTAKPLEKAAYVRQIAVLTLLMFVTLGANAATPTLALTSPVEGFVGESFCTEANLTNSGSTGYGPYYQVVTAPGYSLSSAEFLGSSASSTLVGTFAGPSNELTDPISSLQVNGETGGQLHVVSYPVGSVVSGQPSLTMDLCFAVDAGETIDVLKTDAFGVVPAYEFGDTPTGDNGPIVGTRDDRDFTPRVITYRLEDFTAEMENPPGPAFTFDITAIADIAAGRTVSPIDFSSIMPIVLPPNVQFAGPVTFSVPGCTANTPAAPPPESPGGNITLSCPSATGDADPNVDEDVVISIPVYIVDTLDSNSCSTDSAINTAKHVVLRKGASNGQAPGGTVSYSLNFQISEYVDGIDSLVITDTIPDGLTYANNVTATVGGGSVTITPSVTVGSPGVGQTTVVYDVTAVTGTLAATTTGTITYDATVDENYEAAPLAPEPIRARDSFTNTVVADYDIQNGANACQDNSAATVQVPDVTSEKVLISPANGLLQPGDTAVWRLSLDIPSGDTQQIEFKDFFPLPVIDVSTIDTSLPLSSNTSISLVSPDHTIGDPVSISVVPAENRLDIVWPDVSASTSQKISVDVSTVISSEPFANGLTLSNILEASTNKTIADNISGLNIASLTLQQPDLSIAKTARAPSTNLEAGDVVTYDIVITNDGDAEAYDVLVTDTPAAGLSSCSTVSTSSAGSGDVFSGGFTLTGDLAASASLTVVVSCTLASTVTNNTIYTNTGEVVWAGQPGATSFPTETDTSDVRTAQVEAFKDMVSTSEAHTLDIDGGSPVFPRPLVTGEIVRYRTWAYLPQGVTESAVIRDLLPAGLEYVAGQSFIGLVSNSGTALTASGLTCSSGNANQVGDDSDVTGFALTCAIEPSSGGSGSGDDPRFSLGDVTNAEDDANEELVILEFNARVVGDQPDGSAMNNQMRLITGNGTDTSNSVTAVQQTPALEIAKSVTPTSADANDNIEYAIVFNHASGSLVSAFDIALTDIVPAGVIYNSVAGITGPQAPATPGTDTCTVSGLTVDDSDPDGTGLSISFDELAVGDVCEVRFQATTDSGIQPGQPISNTASLGYTSLPGNGTNPNPTNSAPGAEGSYSVDGTADLTIEAVELTKSIVSTTVVETSDTTADTAGDPRPLTLGEQARYRLQMRLPEGDAPGFVITDNLPTGLQYVANSAAIAFVADGGGTITATPGITCSGGTLVQSGDETSIASITPNCGLEPTGGPFSSGTDPVWNLGDLMNTDMDADDEFVLIEFSATLLDDGSKVAGSQISNTFDLAVDGGATSSNAVFAEVEVPAFGLAKRVSRGPSNQADGTYEIDYTLVVENPGPYAVSAVQVADDLDATFGAGTFTVDNVVATNLTAAFPGYDGSSQTALLSGTDSLASGVSGTIVISLTLTPGSNLGPFDNTATATSSLPSGVAISDVSHDGAEPDGNSDGFANDDSDPTSITLDEGAEIGLAKRIAEGPIDNQDGTFTLTYGFTLENSGEVNLSDVQITEDLDTTFGGASYTVDALTSTDLSVNFPGFDGSAQQNLLAADATLAAVASAEVLLTVSVTPGSNLGPYNNTAIASGTSPAGSVVNDQSNNGLLPDGNSNGDPTDDSADTPVSFTQIPEIGLAKTVSVEPQNNADGTYSLTYRLLVANTGSTDLNNVQVTDNLDTTFAGAVSYEVDSFGSETLQINPNFADSGDFNLLAGNESIAAGASGAIDISVTVTPGSNLGPYANVAVANAQSPSGDPLSDTSDDAPVVDENGNGDPTDDSDPTLVTFSETAVIGLAKSASTPSTPNFDGTFTTTFTLNVLNLGDVALNRVNIEDNLAAQLAPATVISTENIQVSGGLSAVNPAFDGITELNVLSGSETLAVDGSAAVTFDVVFNPNENPGPFSNLAIARAESPGNENPGTPNVVDESTSGSIPDATPDDDPTNDSVPTPVTYVAGTSCTLVMPEEIVPGQPFSITVTDNDSFYDDSVVETFPVTVRNTNSGESEVISVTETAAGSGEFTGSMLTEYSVDAGPNNDGALFAENADLIDATYSDRLTATGSVGTCSDSGVLLGLATLEGFAWLDFDTDDQFGAGEEALVGWIIRVEGPAGIVEVPVNADGSYSVPDLIPGDGYTVSLVHPESGAVFGQILDITLPPQTTVLEQNLAIDPSGVFYDSVDRMPVGGVTATLINSDGTTLPAACLLAGQQSQITGDDGRYRFDIITDADPACASGETYTLVITQPADYNPGFSALIPPLSQAIDPTGLGSPVRVGDGPFAPQLGDATDYHVAFTLSTGDPDVVWNHIPLDPLGVGGFSVRLTKDVNQPTTSVGGLVSYTIALENLSPVTIPGVSVVDSLPPGFSLVEESAALDGSATDVVTTGVRPVTFAGITLVSGQRRELTYVLRAGAGVTHGEYLNTATPFVGPAQIGNSDTAEVLVVADPDFEETTVIGKVWNDRDEDGWQDSATATRIKVAVELGRSGESNRAALLQRADNTSQTLKGSLHEGVIVKSLPGRYSPADFSNDNEVSIRGTYPQKVDVRRITVSSAEGSRLVIEGDNVRRNNRGAVGRGRNSQELEVHYRQYPVPGGYELLIELRNQGLQEPGLPGVRLATVEGLVIETDASGRYHIAGVDGGFMERGRNFIVKLDPATVPRGTKIVSENPRVKRLSQGLMNQFDFAVHVPDFVPPEQELSLKIAEVFFEPGSAVVLPEYRAQLSQLVTTLNRGTRVTLTLKAYVKPGESSRAARRLAQRRADALLATLKELSRRDLSSLLEIKIDEQVVTTKESEQGQEQGMTATLKGALGWILSAMVPAAHAAEADNCMSNICNAAGVPILIVEEPDPSAYKNSRLLLDQGRVDIHGDYVTRLADGGVIWMTEDPARPEPRLSISGPSHVPSSDGRFTADSEFVVHTNYATFFDQLRVEVFQKLDVDRREPLAVLNINTSIDKKLFYQVPWPLAGKPVPEGAELIYRVTAIDAEGRADRTLEQRTFAIDEQTHLAQKENDHGFGVQAYTLQVVSVDDGVVVFVPGHKYEERLEIRPYFPTLGTTLADKDQRQLDTIIERWVGARDVRIEVVGHTSSVPISSKNRDLFADNYALSRARAQSVADYLAKGIKANALNAQAVGRGPDMPVGDNATAEGRALNRRAEISIKGDRVESEPSVKVVNRDTGVTTSFADFRRVAKLSETDASVMPSAAAGIAEVLLKRNDLKQRRIPVYGSRVRVQGNDVGEGHQVWINGEAIRIDRQSKFAVEYILPAGSHVTALDVANGDQVTVQRAVPLEVTGRYGFMVALADFTFSDSNVSGSIEPLAGDDRYAEDMLVEGRLAFYLKGKVRGKYLITAQMDTQEEEVEDLFDNFLDKDPQSLFRRLDPDRYYPVYGDDSTVVADVNTHGRMYVRVDWDNSEAVWGNFESGVTGTELTQYSRGLYGARFTHESMEATDYEESKRHLSAFVSENQTALGHSEFLGTGGSLYYFRHTDILPGSEKLRIEVRDPDTNRVLENNTLTRGLDYEVDELQGRVILSRPLLPLVQGGAPSLILDGALDGSIAVLVADYEYLPDEFDANQVVYGARAKQWFGNHVAIGGTYVEEGRADEDYTLAGVDLTVQAGRDSWLKLEWGTSDATQANRFISTDGGLSFNNATVLAGTARSGDAYNVDLHLNGADFGLTSQWITNAWYKEVDDQFSVARRDDGANVLEYGIESQMPLREWRLGMRASHFEVDEQLQRREVAAQLDGKIGSRGSLSSEIKYIDESRSALTGTTDTTALLLGLQYEHRLAKWISLYAGGQTVVDDSGGYASNDQLSAGAKVALGRRSTATVEYRDGDRGNGALVSLEQRLTDSFAVYGTMTHSTDTTTDPFSGAGNTAGMLDNAGTNFAIGQRWALNDRTRLFTERQFSRNEDFAGVGTVFGLDYATKAGWHYGFTAQDGDITGNSGVIERQTLTVSAGYQGRATRFSSKLEYRDDEGAENVEQWLTSNRFEWKLSPTYRVAAKLNYSESDNALDDVSDAKLIEGSLGLARRPVETNRFNWLAKYTYLHDLQSFGQNRAQTDQRSHIGSWEGIYKLNQYFALGGKVARRMGELRAARSSGPWFKSTANFGSGRLRWHALKKWDAMAEYRWLEIEEADNERAGWLVSIDRHVANNFKVGVGYNFTDFSDDLTDLDYDHKGWFLNVLGKY